jgi:hypothetical protein
MKGDLIMSKIYDINFSAPIADFENRFNDYLKHYNNCDMSMSKAEQATRNGKYVYKFTVTSSSDPNETVIIFEKDASTGNVNCVPSGFGSFGGTFYKQTNLSDSTDIDDDTLLATINFLQTEAKLLNGLMVAEHRDSVRCIVNGKDINNAKHCIVAGGKVYGAEDVKLTDMVTAGSVAVHYNTPLGPWMKERRAEDPQLDIAVSDKSVSMEDKMYFVGKYLVSLRNQEQIEADEFKDLFAQSAALDGFVKDPTLRTIYKLFN